MLRSVTFRRPRAPFNVNETGGIPDEEAARLVACGDAVYADTPEATMPDTTPAPTPAPDAPTDSAADAEKASRRPPADKQARPGKGGVVTK